MDRERDGGGWGRIQYVLKQLIANGYDRNVKDIKNTLKEEGGDGHTYSPEQQKLMVWYTYFFLNRGKPSTHIAALSQLSDEELKENVPPVLQRLIETADHILKGDKNENCAS